MYVLLSVNAMATLGCQSCLTEKGRKEKKERKPRYFYRGFHPCALSTSIFHYDRGQQGIKKQEQLVLLLYRYQLSRSKEGYFVPHKNYIPIVGILIECIPMYILTYGFSSEGERENLCLSDSPLWFVLWLFSLSIFFLPSVRVVFSSLSII